MCPRECPFFAWSLAIGARAEHATLYQFSKSNDCLHLNLKAGNYSAYPGFLRSVQLSHLSWIERRNAKSYETSGTCEQ
jgi:hypothetical protein